MKLYKSVKKDLGVIDFEKLTVGEAYIEGGSLELSNGTLNGNWYQAQAKDTAGSDYIVIWTNVDWNAEEEDACDWDNPDYILDEYGYDYTK